MCCNSYSLLYCAVSSEEDKLVTGGADSQLVVWKDVTEETLAKQLEDRHQRALQDQELANLLHHGDLLPALKLALTLERPATVLNIVQSKLLSLVTFVFLLFYNTLLTRKSYHQLPGKRIKISASKPALFPR